MVAFLAVIGIIGQMANWNVMEFNTRLLIG